jgi:diaminopimelate decarboxylase
MSEQKQLLNAFAGEWDVEKAIKKVKNQSNGPFYLCNLSDVVKKYDDWVAKMPRVKPFYAVSFLPIFID